jgi:hypothetical protein
MRITRKNRRCELPEEVLAVLECSPNLEPCEEFRYIDNLCFRKALECTKVPAVYCVVSADPQ